MKLTSWETIKLPSACRLLSPLDRRASGQGPPATSPRCTVPGLEEISSVFPFGIRMWMDESVQNGRRRPTWVSTEVSLRYSPESQLSPVLLCLLCWDIPTRSALRYSWTSTTFPSPASPSRFGNGHRLLPGRSVRGPLPGTEQSLLPRWPWGHLRSGPM